VRSCIVGRSLGLRPLRILCPSRVYYRNSTGFLSVTSLETFEADTVKEWLESEPEAD
jgi:hypothetical protein